MRQPVINRRRQPSFGLLQDFPGQNLPHSFAKNVFRRRPQRSFHLQLRRQIPSGELSQFAIQKRHPNFYRGGHAHFVVVGQIKGGHENLGIEIQHLVQEIRVLNLFESREMPHARIKCADLILEGRSVEGCFLFPVQVCAVHYEPLKRRQRGAAGHFLCKPDYAFSRSSA